MFSFLCPPPSASIVVTSAGVLSVNMMNSYPQSYGPPTSPANGRSFAPATSPGALDMYGSAQDSMGYMQPASPQPPGFASIAVSTRGAPPPKPSRVAPPTSCSFFFQGTLIPAAFQNGLHWTHNVLSFQESMKGTPRYPEAHSSGLPFSVYVPFFMPPFSLYQPPPPHCSSRLSPKSKLHFPRYSSRSFLFSFSVHSLSSFEELGGWVVSSRVSFPLSSHHTWKHLLSSSTKADSMLLCWSS